MQPQSDVFWMVKDDSPSQSLVLVDAEVQLDSGLQDEVGQSTLGEGGEGREGAGEHIT